jgi:hypothetical protein
MSKKAKITTIEYIVVLLIILFSALLYWYVRQISAHASETLEFQESRKLELAAKVSGHRLATIAYQEACNDYYITDGEYMLITHMLENEE